jgi:putative membrane protein
MAELPSLIALVVGIYERLVESIKEGSSANGSIIKLDGKGFRGHLEQVEWRLLLPLLAGILLAIVLLAGFLEHQLEARPTIVAGAFLGLVLGSVVIAWQLLRERRPAYLAIVAAVGMVVFFALSFGEGEVVDPGLFLFFGAGALAICAMILPGISGSLILLMLGMYAPVLTAVTDRDFVTLGVFTLGAVVGLALFSQGLHWALRHHHDPVLAGLIGLMAGSTRILWPWPDGVDSAELAPPGDDWPAVLAAVAIGGVAVWLISIWARRSQALTSAPTLSS